MKGKTLFIILSMCVLLAGCGRQSGEESGRGYEILARLNSYSCEIIMKVTNNKSTTQYSITHYYKKPFHMMSEVNYPEELKGLKAIYNDKILKIYHGLVDRAIELETASAYLNKNIFPIVFINNFINSKEKIINREKKNGENYLVLESKLPEKSVYMYIQKMWLDLETAKPIKTEIYDINGKLSISAEYDNFVKNPKLEENIFIIK